MVDAAAINLFMQPGASVCSQKKDKLSNTFFQWLPLEFLIPVQKTAFPAGERKVMAGKDLKEKYALPVNLRAICGECQA